MHALREIVDGSRLDAVVALPREWQRRKVEIIVLPLTEPEPVFPRLTARMIEEMLPGSLTQSLAGALAGADISAEEIKAERLAKYESDD
jgi:hypothetical protein